MAAPGTLFGFTEPQVAKLGVALGVAAVIFFKFAIVHNLVRSQKVGKIGAYVLYGLVAVSSASIIAIITLLYFWKD
jgi:hypothetical protein